MEDIKLSDLIYIVRNALTASQCNSLISEYENRNSESVQESCIHANTNLMTTSAFNRITLTPSTENFNVVHTVTNNLIGGWIDYLSTFKAFHLQGLQKSLRFSHLHRLMKYKEGEWIHPHIDWEEMIHGSCTIALNDDYEGGEFKFWNGRHKVILKQGDAMIWPADPFWVHEVTSVTKGVRYSTNTFIQSLPLNERETIGHLIWNMGESDRNHNPYYYKQSRIQGT